MSQTFEEEKSEHAGVLHPSKPINHELDQRESRSMGTRGHNEDEDITLAKILQEQERAFLELRGSNVQSVENVPPGMSSGHERTSTLGSESMVCEGMTDEELAWKLMQEEEHAFQERMMAMAGISVGTSVDPGVEMEQQGADGEIDPDTLTYEELTTLGEMAGTVAAGLSIEQIEKLPQKKYGDVMDHDDPCVICQIEFESSDHVMQLPCEHVYHPDCIHPWLLTKKTCPHCGQEIQSC